MNADTLATAATIVTVTPLTVYDPAISDKSIAAEFARAHNVSERQLSGQKRLLPRNLFDNLRTLLKGLASTFHSLSSPWEDGGARIMRAENIPGFIDTFCEFEAKWLAEREAVLSEWDSVRAMSRQLLNGAFDERRFPSADKIRHHLTVRYEFRPVPTSGDFRVGVPPEAVQSLEEAFEERMAAQKKHLRDGLIKVLSDLRGKLGGWTPGHSRLHGTTLSAIIEVADRLPKLMLDPDPALLAAAESARTAFENIDLDDLRDNEDARQAAIDRASQILVTL